MFRRTHGLGREDGRIRSKMGELMLARGVKQDHACHLLRIAVGIQARIQSANGMSNEQVRTAYLCMHKQQMQFFYDLLACARAWPRIAPSIAGSIIGADACEVCHCWLNLAPIKRGSSEPCIENYRWTARPGTVDVEPVAPNIDEFPWSGVVRSVKRAGNGLIGQPQQQKSHKGQTAYDQQTQETPSDRPTWA